MTAVSPVPAPVVPAPVVAAQFDDPEWVHQEILKLHRDHNATHVRLLLLLDHVHQNSFHLRLGYTSVEHYMVQHLHLKRSTAYEYLRVGRALVGLREVRAAYEDGRICYSQLRDITRIAEPDTQSAWLERAHGVTAEQLHLEIRDAIEKGRRLPREDGYGLPNLTIDVKFRCNLEEREMVTKVVKMLREEIRGSKVTDDGHQVEVSFDEAMVFLFRRAFETGGTLRDESRENTSEGLAPYAMVYQQCPDCRESTVRTDDGVVQVAPERVESLEGEAARVEIHAEDEESTDALPRGAIDKPNTTTLARKVLARDAHRCSNPGCGRRTHLQAHHIRFRSEGGRTALFNETTVCAVCHSLIHAGFLQVAGNPKTGLTWKARADRVEVSSERTASESTAWTADGVPASSTAWTNRVPSSEWDHLQRALTTLGWSKRDAMTSIRAAVRDLERELSDSQRMPQHRQDLEQRILKKAMCAARKAGNSRAHHSRSGP